MENLSDKNLINDGWFCCHCGARNRVMTARFCGQCGTKRVFAEQQAQASNAQTGQKNSIKEIPPAKTSSNRHQNYESFLKNIAVCFLPSPEKAFRMVIGGACCLLLSSVLCGYKMYSSADTIRLTQTKFSDISMDHPVYEVCQRLLSINAIGYRKNREFAPYEKITATEWNHVLNQASKHTNHDYNPSAYFSSNEEVNLTSLNHKLHFLNAGNQEVTDPSRIQSFYILERTLFN